MDAIDEEREKKVGFEWKIGDIKKLGFELKVEFLRKIVKRGKGEGFMNRNRIKSN